MKYLNNKLSIALTAVLGSTAALAQADNPFASNSLSQGYLVADISAPGEGRCGAAKVEDAKCGADKSERKTADGQCGANKTESKAGDGKCAANKPDSKAEDGKCAANKPAPKAKDGKCGEGKCGTTKS